MKKMTFLLALLISIPVMAQSSDELSKKVKEIDNDIAKIESYIKQGEAPEIYQNYLKELQVEKEKYSKLLKQVSKEKKAPSIDAIGKRILPSVAQEKLKNYRAYRDESVPLEKRYDLILRELSGTQTVLSQLKALPTENQSSNIKKFIIDEEQNLAELEKLKVEYEIKIRDIEDSEYEEMKKGGVRVGAMMDVYYLWNFNNPPPTDIIPYKNYTNKYNDFTINLLEINVLKSYRNLDIYADIDFGEQPEQNRAIADDSIAHHLGQAFLRYKFKNDFTLTAGKFYSHFGYETPKNIENKTYSRPFYYFLICPFWHEGISITKSGVGPFGFGLYIYDRSDDRIENNRGKTYGFQANFTSEKFSSVYNLITGPEKNEAAQTSATARSSEGNDKTIHELILTYNATSRLTFIVDALTGYNESFASNGKDLKWNGIVGYVDVKTSEKNSITARVESFSDTTSAQASTNLFTFNGQTSNPVTVTPTDVMGYTLTNRYNLKNGSEVRVEYRADTATEKIFPSTQRGTFRKFQNTAMVGWLYSI